MFEPLPPQLVAEADQARAINDEVVEKYVQSVFEINKIAGETEALLGLTRHLYEKDSETLCGLLAVAIYRIARLEAEKSVADH